MITTHIELTSVQHRLLRKHFEAVDIAFAAGKKGVLAAQIEESYNHQWAYMKVVWLPHEQAEKAIEGMRQADKAFPYAFAGIPSSYDCREWVRFPMQQVTSTQPIKDPT